MEEFGITLWGVDGEAVPLSTPGSPRCGGVGLVSVPEGMMGAPLAHSFDPGSGAHTGVVVDPHQMTLELVVEGRGCAGVVQDVLAAFGGGSHPVTITTNSAAFGVRSKEFWFQQVSQIDWHGRSPGSAVVAHFSIILDAAKRGWLGSEETIVLAHDAEFGEVVLPVEGDMDVWPRFVISGGHDGVTIRLSPGDEAQALPAGGWVVDSHPERRLVADLDGVQSFAGFVPFWPDPVRVSGGVGRLWVEVESPQEDFELQVTFTPEATRAW